MRHSQLTAFHAVAKHGGFSRAAERLNLSQPAISGHVRNLEDTYGVELIRRGAAGIELTSIGRKLFAIAERQLDLEREARELLSKARKLEEGQLILGADAASHVLPLIARFRAAHPRIAVRLEAGNSAQLIDRLESFRLDAAVVAELPANDRVFARPLRISPLAMLVPLANAWDVSDPAPFAALARIPLIIREEGSVTRRLLLQELKKRRLSPQTTIEIETREAAHEAVAQGLGVAVVSMGELIPDTRIRAIAFADWPAMMKEWLIVLKERKELQLIRALLKAAQLSD